MKLYLVRHGEALDANIDPRRGLSDAGREDVSAVARLLRSAGVCPAEVQHSGKARAAQTAAILADALGTSVCGARSDIAPGDPVIPFVEGFAALDREVMVVGHLPFMGNALSALLTGGNGQVSAAFEAGATACVERIGIGSWALRWMLLPSLLRGLPR